MSYHKLTDLGMTPEERRNEADRIIRILNDFANPDNYTEKEAVFIDKMSNNKEFVSNNQLCWLRDIKDKYCG